MLRSRLRNLRLKGIRQLFILFLLIYWIIQSFGFSNGLGEEVRTIELDVDHGDFLVRDNGPRCQC